MTLKSDREAIQAAVRTCNIADKSRARLVRIKNTIELETIWVSESLLPEVKAHPKLRAVGEARPMPFDADGNLIRS
jgi:hypothetical protein